MSDSASRKPESQTSKIAQSQVNDATESSSVGDLSAISEIDDPTFNPHSIGDIKNVDLAANSDVLGDITLLEEAFAEMEDDLDQEKMDQNKTAHDKTDGHDDIPMLSSTVEQPLVNLLEEEQNEDNSIPILDRHPTDIVKDTNSSSESNNASDKPSINNKQTTEDQLSAHDDFDLPGIDDAPAQPTKNADIGHVVTTFDAMEEQNLETSASVPSQETPNKAGSAEDIWAEDSVIPKSSASAKTDNRTNSNKTVTAAPIRNQNSNNDPLNNTVNRPNLNQKIQSKINDTKFTEESKSDSIEEKIARATGDSPSSNFGDILQPNEPSNSLFETELAPGFVDDVTQTHFNTSVGELLPQSDDAATEIYPQQARSGKATSMSIPFELHAQLSTKIDALVLDATMSLTSELELQLSKQLESLLGNAVESVLPKLINQMAQELRTEVNGRVKQQLPIIVNEILGKTRLS